MATWYRGGGTYYTSATTSSTGSWIDDSTTSTTLYTRTTDSTGDEWIQVHSTPRTVLREIIPSHLKPDKEMKIELKDGTVIYIDKDHNFRIDDSDSQVLYKANRIREFNRFINASDLLEEFIRDMGEVGVRQGEVLDTPINVFITWLIYRAARQDGDEVEEPKLMHQPQCRYCGRFISKEMAAAGFEFCNPEHADRVYARVRSAQDKRRLGSAEGQLRLAGPSLAGETEHADWKAGEIQNDSLLPATRTVSAAYHGRGGG